MLWSSCDITRYMKFIYLSVLICVFASLSSPVFARGFQTESILKLSPSQVKQLNDHLMQSAHSQIVLTNQSASPVLSLGKATVNGLTYDFATYLQNIRLSGDQLLATFGGIDSVIRIDSLTYNDTMIVDTGSITANVRISFQCKNLSIRLSAGQAELSLSDLKTAGLQYSSLKADDLKIGGCVGLNDAAQMITSTQEELIKQLQDPKFFNEVYKPQLMPLLVGALMRSEYTAQVADKEVHVTPRDFKIENGYLNIATDIVIPDPDNSEVHDYRVNLVQDGLNVSKPFLFSLFNEVAFKGQKVLSIPSNQIPGLDSIANSWLMKLFVLPELLGYSSAKLHVEVQQVSNEQFYVALMATTSSGVHRVIAAYMDLQLNLDGYVNNKQNFLYGVKVVRGSSRFGFFSSYFIDYVNKQMNGYRTNIFENLQIPGLSDLGIRINLVD